MLKLVVENIKRGEWRRKGTGQADSILEKKKTPSYILSELWTMCLVAMRITYLQPNWPPRLINTRLHTKNSHCQKESNNPKRSQSPCNLYGTHWCRLQCITSWPFWLWIMAVTWLYLPLTLSRLGSRNLGLWTWALKVCTHIHICGCTLKVYKVFTKVSQCPWLKRKLCLGPAGVINCTPLLSKFVCQSVWL